MADGAGLPEMLYAKCHCAVALRRHATARTAKVATDASFVPFKMLDQDSGEMFGFDVDIIREIADRPGF